MDRMILDARNIPAQELHVNIFDAFNKLTPGETMEIVHDHDPYEMKRQLNEEAEGMFKWDYVEKGPSKWRINVTKTTDVGRTGAIENAMPDVNNNSFDPIPPIH